MTIKKSLADLLLKASHALSPVAPAAPAKFGRCEIDTFFNEWRNNQLPIPFASCHTNDLYDAYRFWCRKEGEAASSGTYFKRVIERVGCDYLSRIVIILPGRCSYEVIFAIDTGAESKSMEVLGDEVRTFRQSVNLYLSDRPASERLSAEVFPSQENRSADLVAQEAK